MSTKHQTNNKKEQISEYHYEAWINNAISRLIESLENIKNI